MDIGLLEPIHSLSKNNSQALRLIRRWRRDPALRPSRSRLWGQYILLPMLPNLLAAFMLIPMRSKLRGYLKLYNPDFAWIALVCGSFGRMWTSLRTSLIVWTVQKPRVSKTGLKDTP